MSAPAQPTMPPGPQMNTVLDASTSVAEIVLPAMPDISDLLGATTQPSADLSVETLAPCSAGAPTTFQSSSGAFDYASASSVGGLAVFVTASGVTAGVVAHRLVAVDPCRGTTFETAVPDTGDPFVVAGQLVLVGNKSTVVFDPRSKRVRQYAGDPSSRKLMSGACQHRQLIGGARQVLSMCWEHERRTSFAALFDVRTGVWTSASLGSPEFQWGSYGARWNGRLYASVSAPPAKGFVFDTETLQTTPIDAKGGPELKDPYVVWLGPRVFLVYGRYENTPGAIYER
jgi:hypothetical protein